jgi:hypothetical protein
MLALAGTNAASALLFGVLYAVAGAGMLPQLVFLACLALIFVLATVVWVRTEARQPRLPAVPRLGRIVGGLLLALVAIPVVVLGPIFWLDERLPPEAGLHGVRGGIMALVLIALVLVLLVNLAGVVVALIRSLRRPARRPAATRAPERDTVG